MCTPYYTLAYNICFTCRRASTEQVMLNNTTTLLNVYMDLVYYIYLFGVLKHFPHCTGNITMGSFMGRGNQYI